jgi:hypothetical protein
MRGELEKKEGVEKIREKSHRDMSNGVPYTQSSVSYTNLLDLPVP